MTIDLERYRRVIKPLIKLYVERQTRTVTKSQVCGPLAIATNCPIIAVAHFVGELYGFDAELTGYIDRLVAFYKVDAVINQEQNIEHGGSE